jgi:hypothetical protein
MLVADTRMTTEACMTREPFKGTITVDVSGEPYVDPAHGPKAMLVRE